MEKLFIKWYLWPTNDVTGKQAVVIVGNIPNGTGTDKRSTAISFIKLLGLKFGWMKILLTTISWAGKGSVSPAAFHSPIRTRNRLATLLKTKFNSNINDFGVFPNTDNLRLATNVLFQNGKLFIAKLKLSRNEESMIKEKFLNKIS